MNDAYLWDRSGQPDPEIERLERRLAPLRYRHRPELVRSAGRPRHLAWAVAAAVLLIAAGVWQLSIRPVPLTKWQVAALEGSARLGSQRAAAQMRVRAGQVLRTAEASRVALQSEALGRIEIEPESELRADSDRQVSLQRGHAARLHLGATAPVRAGYAFSARGGPGLRVYDFGGPVGQRTAAGQHGVGGVSGERQGVIHSGRSGVRYSKEERAGHSLLFGRDTGAAQSAVEVSRVGTGRLSTLSWRRRGRATA